MSLVGTPIPPKPASFTPEGAPPGVTADLDAYDQDWTDSRPTIKPRVGVVHTNGGSGEGSYGGAIGWSNRSRSNTHAHYNLNAPQPSKNLSTAKRSIANSTPRSKELEYGVPDSSFWTISIETADRGYLNGGGQDLGDFLYDHAELVARIIAYESIVWDIPIEVPAEWTGTGWLTHVEPFDGVYTIHRGKSCPGLTKRERVLRGDILPRAREIHAAWTAPATLPPPVVAPPFEIEDDMKDLCTIWIDTVTGSNAVYLIGPGGVVHLDGKTRDKLKAAGVEVVQGVNAEVADSYARVARGL